VIVMTHSTYFPIVSVFFLSLALASAHCAAAQPESERLWRTGLNLVPDGTFAKTDTWRLIAPPKRDDDPFPSLSDDLPTSGQIVIYRQPQGNGRYRNILTMNLNGNQVRRKRAVCESPEIRVVPDMNYRLELRCRSGGPLPLILIRGYATVRDDKGQPTLREVRQWRFVSVNPAQDQWNTLRQEFTTDDAPFPIRVLKIQLGGQKNGGYLFFDNLILKAIGRVPPPPVPALPPSSRPVPATAPATQPAQYAPPWDMLPACHPSLDWLPSFCPLSPVRWADFSSMT
jgi:hypothetical protein